MASSIIPLSFDDGGVPDSQTEHECTLICMSVPWLGFAVYHYLLGLIQQDDANQPNLSLQSSLWACQSHSREMSWGFVALLSANIVVLACWTVIDPLTYVREGY
jgi:hypothetical protein